MARTGKGKRDEGMPRAWLMASLLKRGTGLWRVEEAAFLCDCSVRTMWRAIAAGQVELVKLKRGGKRIAHSEVVKYCDGSDPILEARSVILHLDKFAEPYTTEINSLQATVKNLRQRLAQNGIDCQ